MDIFTMREDADRLGSTGCVVRHPYRASVEAVKGEHGTASLGVVRTPTLHILWALTSHRGGWLC